MEDSDTVCPKVQGIIRARESQRVGSRTRSGELRRRVGFVDQTASDSHNFATTTVAEETEGRDVKSFLHPHTVRQDGKKGEQCTATNIAARPHSSSQDITTVGNKPFKVCAWGDSFSVTDETLSTEGRVDGYVPPNSPPVQVLSLRQELEAADAAAGVSLEQAFRAPIMDANWSLATPEAVLGSMDVESSETSTGGGLRATFKQSVDLASRMIKSKKAKGSERKKRVNFQEKPFTDVLAEIEEDDEEFTKEAVLKQADLNIRASNDSVAEASVGRSASNEDDEAGNRAFFQSRADAAKEREIEQKDVELGKEAIEVQARLPLPQEAAGQNNALLAVQQCSTQVSEMVQNRHLVELAAPTRQLSVTPSTAVSSRNTLLSHPFCPSDEGPLLPSASTTLSFMSSDSSVSFGHRVTDLTCLHALADLAVPFQETGDAKSQTGVANLPTTLKPEPSVPEELHRIHLEPQQRSPQQCQVGEQPPKQQRQGKPRPTPSQSPSVEDRSARSSRRCRMLEQAKRQDSVEKRSARLPKRPNTGERQRLSRFATKERRWGDDILQVIMMGNKHYLRERSLSSPRPRSASIPGAALLLDETQYITQQIEQAHAAIRDPDHTCPSPELRQAAESAQAAAAPEEVATTSVRSRESSDSAVKGAILPWSNRHASSPTSLSGRVSRRPSQRTCSRPPSSLASADALGARHATWGPGGEQRKMDTIAEAVCEVELKYPKAVTGAMAPKISNLKTAGDVFSGDTLAKNPVQVIVLDDNEDVAPTLPSELDTESQLTPSSPQWDVCERDLMASIKMLSAAVGTPESFAKTIELPSPEGLQLSETSTMASRVDTVGASSVGCSVALDPSASALSYTRTGSSKNARSRRLSTKILEGACFESMYNSILQPDSSPGLSLSIPGLGSRDFLGFLGPRDRPSGPTSEQSALPRSTDDSKTGSVSADTATTSGPASFASAPAKQECSGSHEVQVQRRAETSAIRSLEPTNSMPPPSSRPRPRSGSRRRASRTPSSGTLPQPSSSVVLPEDSVAEVMVPDSEGGPVAAEVDSEEDRSSFFSFEESASETSLLPDAANLDWWASSQASRSRTDLA
ncbi:hypothetical protein HPB50_025749 [Hyalomma asiaticum]|uniref:Uncharacterized protein n=1 Tax=Hyalomma asiaticum TaxID=266040 RepID=A0ACB7STJ0_HYAAI|nr:hypothetical protein HPB50_025749 [Hyalomma asiaticum]